ncbi:hypothetical protein BCD49_33665 [Pseudofrankia sp. EUN1h]|nr:hypothetical protein BCD49_33665 [Pseudofrankia sp. EUN1h]
MRAEVADTWDLQLAAFPTMRNVAPARILPGQAEHQLHRRVLKRATATRLRIGPPSADQLSMPAQQSGRGNEERRPARTGQELSQAGQQHPIGRGVPRPGDLATRHRKLMAQDGDLDVLLVRPAPETGHAEQPRISRNTTVDTMPS